MARSGGRCEGTTAGLLLWAALGAAACSGGASPGGPPTGVPFLDEESVRRAALVGSLVNPADGYARLRLANYAVPGGWDGLPEWNPRVAPITAAQIDDGSARSLATLGPAEGAPLDLSASATDEAALVALGERAFFAYPAQLEDAASPALASRGDLARFGFWLDGARGASGLLRVEVAGGTAFGLSCAACHAASRSGALVAGLANERLDLGALVEAAGATGPAPPEPWGPGRLDVTTTEGSEPVVISDLRPVAGLTHLHHDATLRRTGREALAVRIETGILVTHGAVIRPPRLIAWALAAYVESLAAALPESPAPSVSGRGGALFADQCASCHVPPAFTGPPVALDVIGTDPKLGRSADRGTGTYGVPSLRGVQGRGLLLHDGSLRRVADLLDPARLQPGYTGGVRPGPVAGHVHGLDLPDADRAALLAYVLSL